MPDDPLGGTTGTGPQYRDEMRELINNPDHEDYGVMYASRDAQDRWQVKRRERALHCSKCDEPMFLSTGAPVERHHIPPGMKVICRDCRNRL